MAPAGHAAARQLDPASAGIGASMPPNMTGVGPSGAVVGVRLGAPERGQCATRKCCGDKPVRALNRTRYRHLRCVLGDQPETPCLGPMRSRSYRNGGRSGGGATFTTTARPSSSRASHTTANPPPANGTQSSTRVPAPGEAEPTATRRRVEGCAVSGSDSGSPAQVDSPPLRTMPVWPGAATTSQGFLCLQRFLARVSGAHSVRTGGCDRPHGPREARSADFRRGNGPIIVVSRSHVH